MKKDLRKIELLFYPDCSAAKPTSTMVEGVLSGLAIEVSVSKIIVDTEQKAKELRFIGSPSVRVDGRDIEPSARERQDFGLN
jgi:hypothetical protein